VDTPVLFFEQFKNTIEPSAHISALIVDTIVVV
jgi:hypothetical protein